METLDRNAMEGLTGTVTHSACGDALLALLNLPCTASALHHECNCFMTLHPRLTEALKACSGEFYVKCPGFDDLGRVCDFEPAFDAAKWKEKIQLDKIAQLEARIKVLEAKRQG